MKVPSLALLTTGLCTVVLSGCTGSSPAPAALATTSGPPVTSAPPSSAPASPVAAAPDVAASPDVAATPAADGTRPVYVYYLGDTGPTGPRLYRELHRRPATTAVVRDAVAAMLTERPQDADYTSLWPPRTRVLGVTTLGTTATVDLSGEATGRSAGASFEDASLQQLVHVVTAAAPALKRVQLHIAGRAVETLWGHVDTRTPIARKPAAEILAPVWLLMPGNHGQLRRGARFGGEAGVFEAVVSWELRRGGSVVRAGTAMSMEGAPGRGPWSAVLPAGVAPGSYVLRAFESSAKDGSATFVDDKAITVS